MRLLLVEDDPMVGESVRKALRLEGFTVDWARDGREAELAVDDAAPYDLVLLDLGLPRRGGLELLRDWRARGRGVPILITTARDAVADRVAGLNAGADDYLVKPYDLDELLARIHALLRRRAGRIEPVLRHGPLQLNPLTREVTLRGEPVALSPREFALLQALLDRPGAVLSVAQLQARIYGWDDEVGSNTVEVYIHALRRKLGSGAVRNVRGVGYMIGAFDEPAAGAGE